MLRVLIEATREAYATAAWYNGKLSGLGDDFLREFRAATDEIESNPDRFPLLETAPTSKGYRRILMHRFPYIVVYRVRPEEILIVAVAHGARKPNYWLNRDRDD